MRCLGQQLLHDQPVFFVQPFLIVIRHQHIVADEVGQTQLNASGVDTLEDLLLIVILVELNVGADQTVMPSWIIIMELSGSSARKVATTLEQHIVVINDAVLALVHLVKLSCP